jgi:O-antigen/teichoic acid export membrane protein
LIALAKSTFNLVLAYNAGRELGLAKWANAPIGLLKSDRRQIARFWFSTNGFALVKGTQQQVDSILVSLWLGPAGAGYLRIARNISNLLGFSLSPLYQTVYPELARLWQKNRIRGLRKLLKRLVLLSGIVAIFGIVAIWLGADRLISLTVGQAYISAGPTLKLMVIGMGLWITCQFYHGLLMAMGKAPTALKLFSLAVIVQIILLIVLIPLIGLEGAGFAFIGFSVTWSLLLVYTTRPMMQATEQPFKPPLADSVIAEDDGSERPSAACLKGSPAV